MVVGLLVVDKIVGNFVSLVCVEKGVIYVMFGNCVNVGIKGKVLMLCFVVVVDVLVVLVVWVCGMVLVFDKMMV